MSKAEKTQIDGLYRESTITTLFKGEFVMVDMVDETIELTVEDNVYSFSESHELLDELQKACAVSRIANSMVSRTYSQQMQDELEPIGEPLNSKANDTYKNHLPRLMKEIEDG